MSGPINVTEVGAVSPSLRISIVNGGGEWTKLGGHAARFLFATVSRPSRTAALVTATR